MSHRPLTVVAAATTVAAGLALAGGAPAGAATDRGAGHRPVEHVLLLSVDGLHQQDLTWWTRHHPDSALARLAGRGVEYPHAQTTFPSDSFPGMVAQVTGGTPKTTGVYYDDSYN